MCFVKKKIFSVDKENHVFFTEKSRFFLLYNNLYILLQPLNLIKKSLYKLRIKSSTGCKTNSLKVI